MLRAAGPQAVSPEERRMSAQSITATIAREFEKRYRSLVGCVGLSGRERKL